MMQSQAMFSVLGRPTSCLITVFDLVKRQRRLGISLSARYIKFATTCVDLTIKRLGDLVCETGSNPQTALSLSNPGCSLVLLLKSYKWEWSWPGIMNWWGRINCEREWTYRNLNNNYCTARGVVIRVRISGFLIEFCFFNAQTYIFRTETSLPKRFFKIISTKRLWNSLRVAPSVKDERVYSIVAKSLLSYITSVPNFWNVIYAKLFVK